MQSCWAVTSHRAVSVPYLVDRNMFMILSSERSRHLDPFQPPRCISIAFARGFVIVVLGLIDVDRDEDADLIVVAQRKVGGC